MCIHSVDILCCKLRWTTQSCFFMDNARTFLNNEISIIFLCRYICVYMTIRFQLSAKICYLYVTDQLGNCVCFCSLSIFFLQNHVPFFFSKKKITKVSNSLDPDQARRFFGFKLFKLTLPEHSTYHSSQRIGAIVNALYN